MYIYIYIWCVCVCVCVCVYQDFYKFFQEGDTPPSLYIVFANAYQEKVDVQKTSINGRTERFPTLSDQLFLKTNLPKPSQQRCFF